jgi:glucose/arabinose dehydrogenase
MPRATSWLGASILLIALLPASPSAGEAYQVPVGFAATPYANIGGAGTSLAFGPDTRDGAEEEATRLYITDYTGNRVLAVDDTAGTGGSIQAFAGNVPSPLGVVVDADGSVFVAGSGGTSDGPFGVRVYGTVWRLRDTDGDGVADKRNVVLKDLPNGRHNTNGMAFGPDGMLYVTNGNSTDDGVEGGEAEVVPWSGSIVRVDPAAKNVSLADLSRKKALVATGWRNIYDLAFSPFDTSQIYVPMNGLDDAREGQGGENPADPNLADSDDLLYVTDIDDKKAGRPVIEDFGFPSCLYNLADRGNLKPYDNPNPSTIKQFGKCPKKTVPLPIASFGLHPSADGLAFQTTNEWDAEYTNDLFVAEWGSLFGEPAGHALVRVDIDDDGAIVGQSDFLEGPTPIDVVFDAAGAMYVLDFSGEVTKVVKI